MCTVCHVLYNYIYSLILLSHICHYKLDVFNTDKQQHHPQRMLKYCMFEYENAFTKKCSAIFFSYLSAYVFFGAMILFDKN